MLTDRSENVCAVAEDPRLKYQSPQPPAANGLNSSFQGRVNDMMLNASFLPALLQP